MNEDIQVADILVHVGTAHWPTPWAYVDEASYAPYAEVSNGEIVGSHPAGGGRGVNLRIPAIPALPEGYEFMPSESRIGIIHDRARLIMRETMAEALIRIAPVLWDGREQAETEAGLAYDDAAMLIETIDLREFPFLAWRFHALLVSAIEAGLVEAEYAPGVIGYTIMAERPFVQYTRQADTPEPEDPRVTLVRISADRKDWADPTGRTLS